MGYRVQTTNILLNTFMSVGKKKQKGYSRQRTIYFMHIYNFNLCKKVPENRALKGTVSYSLKVLSGEN